MPVSNASPLIYLAKIGLLGYLRDFYEDIQIPLEGGIWHRQDKEK